MTAWITGDLLKSLTAPALLLLFFLLNMLGFIRPKRAIDEVRADRDARLAEKDKVIAMITEDRDTWRKAHGVSEQARETQAEAAHEQLELTRASVAALDGFRMAARWLEQERGERPDVVEPPG